MKTYRGWRFSEANNNNRVAMLKRWRPSLGWCLAVMGFTAFGSLAMAADSTVERCQCDEGDDSCVEVSCQESTAVLSPSTLSKIIKSLPAHCNNKGECSHSAPGRNHVETFTVGEALDQGEKGRLRINMLWLVDNSGSMYDDFVNINNVISSLVQHIRNQNSIHADLQLRVTLVSEGDAKGELAKAVRIHRRRLTSGSNHRLITQKLYDDYRKAIKTFKGLDNFEGVESTVNNTKVESTDALIIAQALLTKKIYDVCSSKGCGGWSSWSTLKHAPKKDAIGAFIGSDFFSTDDLNVIVVLTDDRSSTSPDSFKTFLNSTYGGQKKVKNSFRFYAYLHAKYEKQLDYSGEIFTKDDISARTDELVLRWIAEQESYNYDIPHLEAYADLVRYYNGKVFDVFRQGMGKDSVISEATWQAALTKQTTHLVNQVKGVVRRRFYLEAEPKSKKAVKVKVKDSEIDGAQYRIGKVKDVDGVGVESSHFVEFLPEVSLNDGDEIEISYTSM